jgi:hypothetical protein
MEGNAGLSEGMIMRKRIRKKDPMIKPKKEKVSIKEAIITFLIFFVIGFSTLILVGKSGINKYGYPPKNWDTILTELPLIAIVCALGAVILTIAKLKNILD